MIKIVPFGDIVEDRFEEAKKYELVEMIAGIWRFTRKCKSSYDSLSYMKYLQGKIDRKGVIKVSKKQQPTKPERVQITKQDEINSLLLL